MMIFGGILFLLAVVQLPAPTVSGTENDEVNSEAFEQALSNIENVLKEDGISEEERHEKIAKEFKEIFPAEDDIELSKEEIEKLSEPLSKWNEDLQKGMKSLGGQNLNSENVANLMDSSLAKHPELVQEVGNVLKNKDESKVKRLLSKLGSAAKRLGHKLKEKLKSGWKKTKQVIRHPLRAINSLNPRDFSSAKGLFGLIFVIPLVTIIGILTSLYTDDDFPWGKVGELIGIPFKMIYEASFK
ncbi:uncharacterized protein LOC141856822 [Brevipalpus obovatus]|uniref:uncharacterized protein LOC141856822 n=1 Tax=Brevipalpus obovatus TaxID=246614 RepID=UPI003D9E6879